VSELYVDSVKGRTDAKSPVSAARNDPLDNNQDTENDNDSQQDKKMLC